MRGGSVVHLARPKRIIQFLNSCYFTSCNLQRTGIVLIRKKKDLTSLNNSRLNGRLSSATASTSPRTSPVIIKYVGADFTGHYQVRRRSKLARARRPAQSPPRRRSRVPYSRPLLPSAILSPRHEAQGLRF